MNGTICFLIICTCIEYNFIIKYKNNVYKCLGYAEDNKNISSIAYYNILL